MCRDFDTYRTLCDKDMTCFEPECRDQLIEGVNFHKFYFDNPTQNVAPKFGFSEIKVRLFKDNGASISFVKTTTGVSESGENVSRVGRETRVWSLIGKNWKCIHFHRS